MFSSIWTDPLAFDVGSDRVAHSENIMYVELKSDKSDHGPAWIGRVRTSKTGRTLYYRGRTLRRHQGASGNHVDMRTGEEFWVSGIKRDGTDRHRAGGGPVEIDTDVLDEYLEMVAPQIKAQILKGPTIDDPSFEADCLSDPRGEVVRTDPELPTCALATLLVGKGQLRSVDRVYHSPGENGRY